MRQINAELASWNSVCAPSDVTKSVGITTLLNERLKWVQLPTNGSCLTPSSTCFTALLNVPPPSLVTTAVKLKAPRSRSDNLTRNSNEGPTFWIFPNESLHWWTLRMWRIGDSRESVGVVAARPGGLSQFSRRRRCCAHMDSGRLDTYWTAREKQCIVIGVVNN